jgi:hypothetical protein
MNNEGELGLLKLEMQEIRERNTLAKQISIVVKRPFEYLKERTRRKN